MLSPSFCVILSAAKNLLPLRASSAKHLYWRRMNSAKNLPMLRACPERSEGINSAKSLPETGISENRKALPCPPPGKGAFLKPDSPAGRPGTYPGRDGYGRKKIAHMGVASAEAAHLEWLNMTT